MAQIVFKPGSKIASSLEFDEKTKEVSFDGRINFSTPSNGSSAAGITSTIVFIKFDLVDTEGESVSYT